MRMSLSMSELKMCEQKETVGELIIGENFAI